MDGPERNRPEAADAHVTPNVRLGLGLFWIYLLLYLGFMGIAAFSYEMFAKPTFAGVNFAILYGLGLILGALVLAAIYMLLCKPER